MTAFDGLACDLATIHRLSRARTRSISPENFTGDKGQAGRSTDGPAKECARDLGVGWKLSPLVHIEPGQTFTLGTIDGPGAIQHIWMTPAGVPWRNLILRIYWDDQETPSVECPIGDFFACGWGTRDDFKPVVSQTVCVNPGSAFNCYWPMPFRKRCRMTVENRDAELKATLYYQIDYALNDVPDDAAYFHAQFRRVNPLPYGRVYTLLDGVRGRGHYVGSYMAWGLNNTGWWGEGEVKFYLDGDIPAGMKTADAVAEHGGAHYPTIASTGTEDYFCGSYNFENQATKSYQEFNTPYAGVPQIVRPDGTYRSQTRFSLYRWHVPDPVRFESDIAVTVQAIGWRSARRYLPLQDDISSVAFWYQSLPTTPFPPLPDRDALEVI